MWLLILTCVGPGPGRGEHVTPFASALAQAGPPACYLLCPRVLTSPRRRLRTEPAVRAGRPSSGVFVHSFLSARFLFWCNYRLTCLSPFLDSHFRRVGAWAVFILYSRGGRARSPGRSRSSVMVEPSFST